MAGEQRTSILEIVAIAGILLVIAVLAVMLSPIWIPVVLYWKIKDKIDRRNFEKYLVSSEGAKFFCYTNRHTSEEYVETNIVPFLADDIRVFKISDKGWSNLRDDEGFQIRVVRAMKLVQGGFPYVSRIENGDLVTESLNNRLYSAITRKADSDGIIQRIEKFYS